MRKLTPAKPFRTPYTPVDDDLSIPPKAVEQEEGYTNRTMDSRWNAVSFVYDEMCEPLKSEMHPFTQLDFDHVRRVQLWV